MLIMAISIGNCIVEVNTRGYYKGITKEFYPSMHILKKCLEADIHLTINSDAHHPNEIANSFEDVASALLDIGYSITKCPENKKNIMNTTTIPKKIRTK